MNNLKLYLFLMVLFSLLLTACTTVVYMDLLHIQKGQSKNEVVSIITNEDYEEGISLINENHEDDYFEIEELDASVLLTYKYYERNTGNNNSYYVFAFINDELTFWGLPYEFANHRNPDMNYIGIEASNILTEKYLDN